MSWSVIADIDEQDLIDMLEARLSESRMFLVGAHITLADFINFIRLQETLFGWEDVTKVTFPNVFRWADHIQHLPYIWDMVQ